MRTVRVAFAGLSPLSEEIFRSAIALRPGIELVSPWTKLPSLACEPGAGEREVLILELDGRSLPSALRALLAAAPRLRIAGISADARTATLFHLSEERTLFFDWSAEQLCSVLSQSDP